MHPAVEPVIFCGFISLLIGRETINIPEIFSGVHGFTGKTVRGVKTILLLILQTPKGWYENNYSFTCRFEVVWLQ